MEEIESPKLSNSIFKKIIIIKRDLSPVAIDYQSSLSFELSDACQIEETKYILVINYISHTE
jgi:hypothetical protein